MFNKNKRTKKFSDLLIPGIILIIIGIVFAFQGIRDYSKLNGDLLNLNTASEKDLDAGKYVEIDVDYAFILSVRMLKLQIMYSKEQQTSII